MILSSLCRFFVYSLWLHAFATLSLSEEKVIIVSLLSLKNSVRLSLVLRMWSILNVASRALTRFHVVHLTLQATLSDLPTQFLRLLRRELQVFPLETFAFRLHFWSLRAHVDYQSGL